MEFLHSLQLLLGKASIHSFELLCALSNKMTDAFAALKKIQKKVYEQIIGNPIAFTWSFIAAPNNVTKIINNRKNKYGTLANQRHRPEGQVMYTCMNLHIFFSL